MRSFLLLQNDRITFKKKLSNITPAITDSVEFAQLSIDSKLVVRSIEIDDLRNLR